eukprot:273342-Chlamydomonas_euryale.AAC.13
MRPSSCRVQDSTPSHPPPGVRPPRRTAHEAPLQPTRERCFQALLVHTHTLGRWRHDARPAFWHAHGRPPTRPTANNAASGHQHGLSQPNQPATRRFAGRPGTPRRPCAPLAHERHGTGAIADRGGERAGSSSSARYGSVATLTPVGAG